MPNDVVDNAQSSNSTIKNSTIVVGAPKAAGTAAYGAKFTINAAINDAADLPALQDKLKDRFDDPRYYNGDNS